MFKRLRKIPSRIGDLLSRNPMLMFDIIYAFSLTTLGIFIGFFITMFRL